MALHNKLNNDKHPKNVFLLFMRMMFEFYGMDEMQISPEVLIGQDSQGIVVPLRFGRQNLRAIIKAQPSRVYIA